MMTKNPFSFYDFLGYLFPGLTTLMLTAFVMYLYKTNGLNVSIDNYIQINDFVDALEGKLGLNWWESTVLVVVLAYIAGHIVAYLSSVTIEYFANASMGYPSYYLLHKGEYRGVLSAFFQGKNEWTTWKIMYRIWVFSVLLPIIIFTMPKTLRRFISRPLDEYVINSIQAKLMELSKVTNYKICLCPIGMALGHTDSVALRRIADLMTDNYFEIKDPNIFDIMWLIKHSKMYIGVSLHGAISAMSFNVPYIGYGSLKVKYYFEQWTDVRRFTTIDRIKDSAIYYLNKDVDSTVQKKLVMGFFNKLHKLYK